MGRKGKEDQRPARNGWVPGVSDNACACDELYVASPRSRECADCAYSKPIDDTKRCYRPDLTAIKNMVKFKNN